MKQLQKLKDKPDAEISSKFFQQSVKMFDPRTGNYDTKHERALCRMVSGLPPAIMLATDAYNLSRMMDDDPAAAKKRKESKIPSGNEPSGYERLFNACNVWSFE